MEEIKSLDMPKAFLVGVCSGKEEIFAYEMKELESLAQACNMEVIDQVIQYLPSPNNSTYVGSGKIMEIAEAAKLEEADVVIFNDELSPATLSNICDVIECEVMDRTMLILEIFKTRAKTREAKLQVELANLNYMLPRLIGARKNLSRTGGGGGGGGGARRGSGEQQIELDRRHIQQQIYKVKQDLAEITLSRQTARKSRVKSETKTVAVVGYTNAGKSSTINNILKMYNMSTDKQVFVKDMLFATLETSTRRILLDNNHEFLITDTVGFVSKLPHHLVESFKSTLEEITEADLIIHLIDASSPYVELQTATTNEVLQKLGCSSIPIVYVFNKMDLVKNEIFLPKQYEPSLRLCNPTLEGFKELIAYIEKNLFPDDTKVKMLIPYTQGDVYNLLKEKANVLSTEYQNEGIMVEVIISTHLYNLYKNLIIE